MGPFSDLAPENAVIGEETADSAPGAHRHSDRGENHGTDRGLPGLSIDAGPDTRLGELVLHCHRRLGLNCRAVELKFAPECGMGNAPRHEVGFDRNTSKSVPFESPACDLEDW